MPRLIHVDVHDAANGHTHLDLRYLLIAPDRDPTPPPGESPEARWFGWEEATAVADPALVGALRAARLQPEVRRRGRARAAGLVAARSARAALPGTMGRRRPGHTDADGTT